MPKATRLLLIASLTFGPMCGATARIVLHTPSFQDTTTIDSTRSDSVSTTSVDSSGARTTAVDSLAGQKAMTLHAGADSSARMSTLAFVGTLDRSLDSSHAITREDLHWLDYLYLGEILETVPGIYVRDQNSIGQYNQMTIRGQDWRSIAVTMDGQLMNDPASGIYNLFQFSPEYADRIEIVTGPRAFLYGLNSTGGAINLVTRNYNSIKPFTKIIYSETGYNYLFSDGTFTQNLSRKVNFTFGFQHESTDGRFPNSDHESWNMRVKLRYSISPDLNLIIAEYLTSAQTGLNGGVDPLRTVPNAEFDPLQATLRNTDSYEKLSRNDVNASLIGTILGDTANVSMLKLYYSDNFRQYRDDENRPLPNGILIHSDHTSSWMGALFTQNLDSRWQHFDLGANIELRQIEGSPNLGRRRDVVGSLWGKEELLLQHNMAVAVFARHDRYLGRSYLGIGADMHLRLWNALSVFGGISSSRRVPTYEELFWEDNTVSRTGEITAEKHRQAEIGTMLHLGTAVTLRAAYSIRAVDDAITILPEGSGSVFPGLLFANSGKITTQGVEAKVSLLLGWLELEGTATFLIQEDNSGTTLSLYPKVFANGGAFYRNTLFQNELELKVGFRGRFQSYYTGEEFNPEVLAYVPGSGPTLGAGSSVDFFLIAHIGDAYLHLMWDNLTGIQYYTTPFYPILDREFRFGIAWEFLN